MHSFSGSLSEDNCSPDRIVKLDDLTAGSSSKYENLENQSKPQEPVAPAKNISKPIKPAKIVFVPKKANKAEPSKINEPESKFNAGNNVPIGKRARNDKVNLNPSAKLANANGDGKNGQNSQNDNEEHPNLIKLRK